MMTFKDSLYFLRKGEVVTRDSFDNKLVIFMQVPAKIEPEKIPNVLSIPESMKELMTSENVGIIYHDQFMLYNFGDQTCTNYTFSEEDINANDWNLVFYLK